jgi:hypothetical protein
MTASLTPGACRTYLSEPVMSPSPGRFRRKNRPIPAIHLAPIPVRMGGVAIPLRRRARRPVGGLWPTIGYNSNGSQCLEVNPG